MDIAFGKGHACIIGIGGDLPCTVADAKGLSKILQDPLRCAYPAHQVHLLTETAATRPNIISTLEHLANTTTEDSTVLIYFSGHGFQVTKPLESYYLLPHGYNTKHLSETALSGAELIDLLRDIPAQKLLLLLDCCHAGGLANLSEFQVEKSPLPPEAHRMFSKGGGRMIIGSSLPDELSYSGNPYSAFTTALIEGLCGEGVSREDGYVRAADLAMYASRTVSTATQDKQHPVLEIEKADNFVLAYYAGGKSKPKALPPELANGSTIDMRSEGVGTQTVASGDRSVAIGGNANGSTIVSGDGNSVRVGNVVQTGKYNINIGEASGLNIGDG